MYLVNKETSSVIGKGNKERFTTFAFPEHLELPSEWQVRTALKKIGLKPHSLRKLLATKLSRNSDIKNQDILAIMGWSSLETANKYLQPLNEQQLKQKMKEILE
jgi:integrase